jgi:hypothetical protein
MDFYTRKDFTAQTENPLTRIIGSADFLNPSIYKKMQLISRPAAFPEFIY